MKGHASVRVRAITTKAKGDALELRVGRILAAEGRWGIRRNVQLRDSHGNRSQIDLRFGWLRPTYVECKNYAAEHRVSLDDVAKFKEVLRLNGIGSSRGLFITTSAFTPRALTTGLRTLDGEQLAAWEKRARLSRRRRLAAAALALAASAALLAAALSVAPASATRQDPPSAAHAAVRMVVAWRDSLAAHPGAQAALAQLRRWLGA